MSRHRTRQDNRSTNQDARSKKSTRKSKQQHHMQPQKLVAPTIALTVALTGPTGLAGETEVLTAPEVEVQEQRSGYIVPYLGLSRFPEQVRDIPQTINIIPQELMKQQADFSLQDALRNVTGISFQAGEGGGAQGNNLSIRGFNARNDIFLYGMRDQGSYFRDTFNLEAVEVLKGPSALYFGRGTTGGIINQLSKLPRLESFYSGALSFGNGFLARGTGDINQRIGETTALRVNFMGYMDDIVDRDYVDQRRGGLAPSVTFGLGTSTQLTLSYFLQHEDNIPDYGLPFLFGKPPDVNRGNFYGLANGDSETTWVNVATLRLDHRFNDQLSLRNMLRYSNVDRQAFVSPPLISGNPTPGTPLSQIIVAPNHPGRSTTEEILDNQLDLLARFQTFDFNHTLLTGMEIGTEGFNATRYAFANIPTTPLVNPNPLRDTSRMTKSVSAATDTSTFLLGLYFSDTIRLLPQLDLVGGVRYDLFDADFINHVTNDKFSSNDNLWSYRAGLVFHPWPTHSYYFSYSNSYNPSAEALQLAATTVDTPPEENQTYEIGGKVDLLEGGLSLQGALFWTEKTNGRTPDPLTGLQVLEGKQRVKGFELGMVGRPLPALNVFLGYTYLDSEIVESNEVVNGVSVVGNRMPNAPQNSLSLWTTYDFLERWQVGTGIFYVDERFANTANSNVVPSYVRWDMTVGYQLTKNIQLRLNALNLTNELYFDGIHPQHIIPGAGTTIIGTALFNF
jgi:catecholate siderophore receptor